MLFPGKEKLKEKCAVFLAGNEVRISFGNVFFIFFYKGSLCTQGIVKIIMEYIRYDRLPPGEIAFEVNPKIEEGPDGKNFSRVYVNDNIVTVVCGPMYDTGKREGDWYQLDEDADLRAQYCEFFFEMLCEMKKEIEAQDEVKAV